MDNFVGFVEMDALNSGGIMRGSTVFPPSAAEIAVPGWYPEFIAIQDGLP